MLLLPLDHKCPTKDYQDFSALFALSLGSGLHRSTRPHAAPTAPQDRSDLRLSYPAPSYEYEPSSYTEPDVTLDVPEKLSTFQVGDAMAAKHASEELTLFLCGDVMTGRGIDQIMPHPSTPELYEPYVRDARQYAALAEKVNGRIEHSVGAEYIWGDALTELEVVQPDLRFINLETSITTSDSPWPEKAIHYRMHPANIGCLTVAKPDVCALANNHVLDWDYAGLHETLDNMAAAGLTTAGAGRSEAEAKRPALCQRGNSRVAFLSCAVASSGTPEAWAAREDRAGVFWLPDLSDKALQSIAEALDSVRELSDITVCSIHWGGNWGHAIEPEKRAFAHRLIDEAGVDVIHGHSSHHPQCIEVHEGKPILYGCGDFINDYEGIRGYEKYRSDLTLMYFLTLSPEDKVLTKLEMVPMQLKKFQLHYALPADTLWLSNTLNEVGAGFANPCTAPTERSLLLEL
jgi:poly-gamma-glutamate capsule biosynthesis protein CapA/YwtB (metallophosphatase superfamily)